MNTHVNPQIDPAARCAPGCGCGEILIEWAAIPNSRPNSGYLPVLWVNGKQRGSTWAPHGLDKDEVPKHAEAMAREEADRYCGDWTITIRAR